MAFVRSFAGAFLLVVLFIIAFKAVT